MDVDKLHVGEDTSNSPEQATVENVPDGVTGKEAVYTKNLPEAPLVDHSTLWSGAED